MLLPYLKNLSEKAISDITQFKEQHEIIKLLKEEMRMLQQKLKDLDNKSNISKHEKLLTSHKNFLFHSKIDNDEIIHVLHDNVAPLTRTRSEDGTIGKKKLSKRTPKEFGTDTKLLSHGYFSIAWNMRFEISGDLYPQMFSL